MSKSNERKIGWIGTGVMGLPMCLNLIKQGINNISVYNRTAEKARPLIEAGAVWADSPREIAMNCDIIFTIIGYPRDVREIYLGEKGLIASAKEGTILVDMTTSTPSLAREIYDEAYKKNVHSLDAPVSGGDIGAQAGTLAVMIGGRREICDELMPLFTVLGDTISYMGKAGSGQHTKAANQIVIAGNMIGTVEGLLYGYANGLDQSSLIDIIGTGAAGSWNLNNLGRKIARGDYAPGFFIKHFIKDMKIALDEAQKTGLDLPGLSQVYRFYLEAEKIGLAEEGTQALYKVLEKMNRISR